MGTLFVDKLDPQSGTSLEIGSNGDTITIPSGCTITNSGTASGFGSSTDVAFLAGLGSNQTLAHETWTKLDMSSEIFDVGSCYDPSNDKFTVPTGKGGYYNIGFKVTGENAANSRQYIIWTKMYLNGSSSGSDFYSYYQNNTDNPTRNITTSSSVVRSLSAGDTLELYCQSATNNSSSSTAVSNYTLWWAYRLAT
jgi:hypothetical protein